MAKALFGYLGGPDPGLIDEIRRLRRLVGDLEQEVARLQATCDALAADSAVRVSDADVLALALADVREHVGALH